MSTDVPRYTLRTVEDFHTIPDDKIKHCVEDFLLWLLMVRHMRKEFGDLPGFALPNLDTFGWLDDGKHDANF